MEVRSIFGYKDETRQLAQYSDTSLLTYGNLYVIVGVSIPGTKGKNRTIYIMQPILSSSTKFWLTPGVAGKVTYNYTIQSQYIDKKYNGNTTKYPQGCCVDFNYDESYKLEKEKLDKGACVKDGSFTYTCMSVIEELKGRKLYVLPTNLTYLLQESK